jgi:hypothetical protein
MSATVARRPDVREDTLVCRGPAAKAAGAVDHRGDLKQSLWQTAPLPAPPDWLVAGTQLVPAAARLSAQAMTTRTTASS